MIFFDKINILIIFVKFFFKKLLISKTSYAPNTI